jgi:hypothetical protein
LVFLCTEEGKSEDAVFNQVLRILARSRDAQHAERFPAMSREQKAVVKRWLDYIAGHLSDYYLDPDDEELLGRVRHFWSESAS